MKIPEVEWEVWDANYGRVDHFPTSERDAVSAAAFYDERYPQDAPHMVVRVTREVVS